MALFSTLRDKKQYYMDQAAELRRQAQEVRETTDNYPEAKRLESLAQDAEKQAIALDEQIRNMGE